MTQLQAFVYFLRRMDIVMLNDILTDDISYCGTTKSIFLEKLKDIFVWNVFLENETLPVKWSESNTNCLQFFCWKPDEWVNTLLVTSMKDGKIISFMNKTPHFGFHNSSLRIYEDEEIGFVKSTEFIMLQNQCKNAIDEMTDVVITTDLILNWLKEYKFVYNKIIDEDDEIKYKNIEYIEEFYKIWDTNLVLEDYILKYKEAEIAVKDFEQLDLVEWLDKYNYLYYCVICPRSSGALFLCDKTFRFKDGMRKYESKELYFIEKFIAIYYESNQIII